MKEHIFCHVKRFQNQRSSSVTYGRHGNLYTTLKRQMTPGTGDKCNFWTAIKGNPCFFVRRIRKRMKRLQTHPGSKLHVMYQTLTSSNLNSFCPKRFTYYMVSNSSQPIQKCDSTSCRVFVRRADVKKIQTNTYSYAWTGQDVKDNRQEGLWSKNNKTLSGMDYTLY